jgi:hypothetical protein
MRLQFLGGILFINALGAVGTADGRLLFELLANRGTVNFFFENGLGLDGLEFGLEVFEAGVGAAVGATTWVRQVVAVVFNLDAFTAPVMMKSGC